MSAQAMAVGAAMKLYGQYKQNMDQADAEERNARFYDEQAAYTAAVGARKLKLMSASQEQFLSKQKSMFSAAGISFSGSALDTVVGTQLQQQEEQKALAQQNDMETKMAQMKADSARRNRDALQDPTNNLLQGAGSLLTMAAAAKGAG